MQRKIEYECVSVSDVVIVDMWTCGVGSLITSMASYL